MQETLKEGMFGEIPYRAILQRIEPESIVAGVRMELGYWGITIEFPSLRKREKEGVPYVSWQLPLRNSHQITEGLRGVFRNDPPPEVLQGTMDIIGKFTSSST